MKNITPKQNNEFIEIAESLIYSHGAKLEKIESEYFIEDEYHVINTIAGRLKIRIDKENKHCFTIYCRFEDPKKSAEQFPCLRLLNKFSGKYNLHFSKGQKFSKQLIKDEINFHLSLIK